MVTVDTPYETYSIARLMNRRDRVMAKLSDGRATVRVDGKKRGADYVYGEHYTVVAAAVYPVLANVIHGAKATVIESSLFSLLSSMSAGYPVERDVKQAVHVMLANERRLRRGYVVDMFTEMRFNEWVPVVLINANNPTKYTERGVVWSAYDMEWLCLGGQPATTRFKQPFRVRNRRDAGEVKGKMFGVRYDRRKMIVPYAHFVGFRTWAHIPAGDSVRYNSLCADVTAGAYNTQLLQDRRSEPCPLGRVLMCTECEIGLQTCYRSVHFETYTATEEEHENGRVNPCCEDARRKTVLSTGGGSLAGSTDAAGKGGSICT